MKSKSRFFAGFIAAALTFGTLMATMGPQRFMHHRNHCCASQCNNNRNDASETQHHVRIEDNKTIQQ